MNCGNFSTNNLIDAVPFKEILYTDNIKYIDLLSIDVEGAELDVLASGKKFLQSNSEILVEISLSEHVPNGNNLNPTFLDTFQLMNEYGYSSYTWCEDFALLDKNSLSKIMNGEISPTIQMYCFKK